MALISYPFENANTTEDQYTLLFRNFARSGIVGSHGDGQFLATTDGSGLDVQIAPGYAILRGHAVLLDAPASVNIDAADANAPRIDRIVLRLDPDQDGIVLHVIKGTPNANPSLPPIVRTDADVWDLPIAQVRVPAAALNINPDNVAGDRTWSGGDVGVWHTDGRPSNPRVGTTFGYNVATGTYEFWDGSGWKSVGGDKKKIVVPHTFTLAGPIAVANAQGDYFIPGFYIPPFAGQKVRAVGYRAVVHHGPGNDNFDMAISVNGSDIYSGNVHKGVTASATAVGPLAANGYVSLRVIGINGSPKNASITVFLEYEV